MGKTLEVSAHSSYDSDPHLSYLRGLVSDVESHAFRRSGSAAICLGAFARLDRLGRQVPWVVHVLARAIRSGKLDEIDLWLCSTALRTVVFCKPEACRTCVSALRGLMGHRNGFVVEDVAAALSSLETHRPQQPAAQRREDGRPSQRGHPADVGPLAAFAPATTFRLTFPTAFPAPAPPGA